MNINTIHKFFIAFLLFSLSNIYCHHRIDYNNLSNAVVTKWGIEDGMLSSFIYDIETSADGFLWVATTRGLSKFDGSHFNYYDNSYIENLDQDEITCLDINESGNIIFGTSNRGVVEYISGEFTHLNISDNALSNIILDVKYFNNDEFLIATQTGLYLRTASGIAIVDSSLYNMPIAQILIHEQTSRIYLATLSGVLVYDFKFQKLPDVNLLDNKFSFTKRVLIDSKNNLWIGTNSSLFKFENGKLDEKLNNISVYDIKEDSAGKIWVATYDGVFIFDQEKVFNLNTDNSLADNRVRSIFLDEMHNIIWIGTYNGLNAISHASINTIDKTKGLIDNQIRSLIEDKDGNILIGTSESGLYKYNKISNSVEQIIYVENFQSVWSLYVEQDGTLWAGSIGKIARVKDREYQIFEFDEIRDEVIRAISPSINREGYLILATDKGNILLSNGNELLKIHGSSRIKDNIYKIFNADDGNMYIGTQVGLFVFDFENSKQLTVQDGLSSNSIKTVYLDDEGIIWLGTNGGGLVRFDGENFFSFSLNDGLVSKDVWYIVEDNDNNFWMSCDEGIFVVNKNDLDDYRNGIIKSLSCLSFGVQEGMKNLECTTSSNAGLLDKEGKVWFSTMSGAISFNPQDLLSRRRTFEVYIEKLVVDNQSFLEPADLSLPMDVENIEIHYGILHFGNTSDLDFNYKLDDYNTNWVNTGKRRVAYFGQLPPGDYTFNVHANLGFNEDKYKSTFLNFNRAPNIWETVYFQIFLYAAGIVLVLAFIRFRINQVRKRNKELLEEINKRKIAEKGLLESEEKYRRLFENSSFGIYRSTMDGHFLTANKSALDILGFKTFEELSKVNISQDLYASKQERENFLSVLMQNGSVSNFEHELHRKDGKKISIREGARLVKDEQGIIIIEGGFEDITENNEYKNAIIEAKEKAEKSDRIKSEFLAQMSHEIRTPVNTILSFNSLIKQELSEEECLKFKEYFASINNGSKRLIRTIDSILNLSQLQSGSYEVIKTELDLNKICSGIYSEFKQQAQEKGITLVLETTDSNSTVLGDHYSVSQMVVNLVDNAIKYTLAGRVFIAIKNEDDQIQVEVQDTGIGMADEFISNLYEPFTQEETGYSRKFEGTGLGLTLVKYYAELNNAIIDVKSKKNFGTTFTVTFPNKLINK